MTKRSMIVLLVTALAVIPTAWAAVNVNTLPPPPPTTKLRLYVHLFTTVSGDIRQGVRWPTSHEDYLANQIGALERAGIYEIVGADDAKAAIGDQDISYGQMERNDWGLAQEIGKALHADYVMVITRKKQKGMHGIEFVFEAVMVNTGTGRNYRTGYTADSVISADVKELAQRNRQAYHTIFSLAKEDLLAVAVKKSRAFAPKTSAPPMRPEPIASAPGQGPGEGAKKVLVYDLDANEQYQTVAMLLAEALREELLALKKLALADQSDLQKVRRCRVTRNGAGQRHAGGQDGQGGRCGPGRDGPHWSRWRCILRAGNADGRGGWFHAGSCLNDVQGGPGRRGHEKTARLRQGAHGLIAMRRIEGRIGIRSHMLTNRLLAGS
jgi:hypothetical protein